MSEEDTRPAIIISGIEIRLPSHSDMVRSFRRSVQEGERAARTIQASPPCQTFSLGAEFGNVDISVAFVDPDEVTTLRRRVLGVWPAERAIQNRIRRSDGIRNGLIQFAGSYEAAVRAHYLDGAKHPDDQTLPLNLWDSTE